MGSNLKVKDISARHKLAPSDIISELISMGVNAADMDAEVPENRIEQLEARLKARKARRDSDPALRNGGGRDRNRGGKAGKAKPAPQAKSASGGGADAPAVDGKGELHIKTPIVVKALAEALGRRPNEIIAELMKLGELVSINQPVPEEIARKLCAGMGVVLVPEKREKSAQNSAPQSRPKSAEEPEKLVVRPPVATFMGHVDHGKTSLQDYIRHTSVVSGEAGHITQHIGASTIMRNGQQITFIDTPGHAAFTQMRARGANVTDVVVLVVAADDGFMPQTVEALHHAQAAKVPIIVAINKIDLPAADCDRVLLQMQQNNLTSEEWGGDVGTVRVSAKTGEGIDDLLDRILLESEMLELKANPRRPASGVVLEAQLEQGMGATTNVLVQNGTLKIGDAVLCGEFYGRVKSLIDDKGKKVKSAGPSTPVKLVGLSGVPEAGCAFEVCENEKEARQRAEEQASANRGDKLSNQNITSIDDLFNKMDSQSRNKMSVVIKSDVRGSGEAIEHSLTELPDDKIKVEVVMNSVGAITENDVMLAAASGAMIVGFHVRVNPGVNEIAKKHGVEIRLYSIIYELLEDITDALTGRLDPEKREKPLGKARILQIFELSKGPKVCGCLVESGVVKVSAKARVFRKKELIYNGSVASLRRFQDDVKEVKAGLECGIRLDNFNDFLPEDIIEIYEIELRKASL